MPFVVTIEEDGLRFLNSSVPVDITLPSPVVELAFDNIHVYDDFGEWERTFHFSDFNGGTIDGASPANLQNAFDLLSVAASTVRSSSGGGALPVGAATSANQSIQISLESDMVDLLSTGIATMPVGGMISPNNSSTSNLGAGAVFTGSIEDVVPYNEIRVWVYSDVASAAGGLAIQFSSNGGATWFTTDSVTIQAGQVKQLGFGPGAGSFRVVYTNGATPQGTFMLQTVLKRFGTKASSVIPQDARPNDNDMTENLSYGMVYDPIGNVWNRMQSQDLYITGQATQTAVVNNVLTSTSGTTAIDCIQFRSASVQVVSTGTGGTYIFEGSNDNVNFQAIPVFNQAILTGTPITSAITATNSQIIYHFSIPFRYIRLRIATTITGGSIQAFSKLSQMTFTPSILQVAQATSTNLNTSSTVVALTPGTNNANLGKAEDGASASGDVGVFTLAVRRDSPTISSSTSGDYNEMAVDQYGSTMVRKYGTQRRTYSSAFQVVPAATATDVVEIIGSATTNVQILRVTIGGVQTTGGGVVVNLIKRSSAATGGTSTNATIVSHESTDTGATAVIKAYTANPTPGTAVGNVKSRRVQLGAATSVSTAAEFTWGENSKPIILAGVSQTLCINLGGVTVTGGTLDIEIEFTEI